MSLEPEADIESVEWWQQKPACTRGRGEWEGARGKEIRYLPGHLVVEGRRKSVPNSHLVL